jgi:hypothetical protein
MAEDHVSDEVDSGTSFSPELDCVPVWRKPVTVVAVLPQPPNVAIAHNKEGSHLKRGGRKTCMRVPAKQLLVKVIW